MRKMIFLLAAVLLASSPAVASTLPKHSLLCGDMASMKEADRAVSNSDTDWLESLQSCLFTNQDLKAGRIECEGRFCKIRLWVQGYSTTAYTYRRALR